MYFEKIKSIISKELFCDISEIHDDAKLKELDDMDSLTTIAIITAIEEEFNIEVPDDEFDSAHEYTVSQFSNKIKEIINKSID